MSYVYLNNKLTEEGSAEIKAFDRGFLYGDGLFETIRIYNKKPFLLEEHLKRLEGGASFLGIELPQKSEGLREAVTEIIEANAVSEGFLRLTVSRGVTRRAVWPGVSERPTVLITSSSALPYTEGQYEKGFRALPLSFPLNEKSPISRYKTLNYLENILGRREAEMKGFDEGIFVNTAGYLAECTASNLFIVREKTVYTPPVESGALPGITRNLVIELAAEKYAVYEDNITLSHLKEAHEAFLTNSLMEIMPLSVVGRKEIGRSGHTPVTDTLRKAYREKVLKTIADD